MKPLDFDKAMFVAGKALHDSLPGVGNVWDKLPKDMQQRYILRAQATVTAYSTALVEQLG